MHGIFITLFRSFVANQKKWQKLIIHVILLFLIFLTACAPTYRIHPQFYKKIQSVKTVAIMPPNIKVYQLTAGGTTELMPEWTSEAQKSVLQAVEEEISSMDCFVCCKPFPTITAQIATNYQGLEDNLKESQDLYEAVNSSIITHTYIEVFPEKVKNFDYSLGSEIQELAQIAEADALLFTWGVDYRATGGRKALGVLAAIVAGIRLSMGITSLSAALVDSTTGSILWYNFKSYESGPDLRKISGAKQLVHTIFKNFSTELKVKR